MSDKRETREGACPQCGDVAVRDVYDIGSGPEVACASCEWCWGADGQPLKPIMYEDVVRELGFDPLDRLLRSLDGRPATATEVARALAALNEHEPE